MISYKNLTLRDKLAFLEVIKGEASQGAERVAQALRDLDVTVNETDLRLALRSAGWGEQDFHALWEECPTHYGL
jgi:hypothetical protein